MSIFLLKVNFDYATEILVISIVSNSAYILSLNFWMCFYAIIILVNLTIIGDLQPANFFCFTSSDILIFKC